VTDVNASMPFAPGEWHVYTDQPLDVPDVTEIDVDLDGQLASEGDCNDNDATIYVGAEDPLGDGIDQDCDGVDGPSTTLDVAGAWAVFPNPVWDVLRWEGPADVESLWLEDIHGRRLGGVEMARTTGRAEFHVADLAPGTYLLVGARNGQRFSTPVHKINR